MRRPKPERAHGKRSHLTIVGNDKGGQGKTVCTLAVADHAYLHDVAITVAQVDTQLRLTKALGRAVLTIEPTNRQARRDPAAEARSFTPLYALLEKACARGENVLLDAGANQGARLANWMGLVELDDDLRDWQMDVTLMLPFVAEAEGMRMAGQTASMLMERLPGANLVLVENQRDGALADLHPASDAAEVYRTSIAPLLSKATLLKVEGIAAGSWRPFEAAGCRLVQVAQMPVEQVIKLTGLPRPEAKIARGDVAAWTSGFFGELDRVLPWGRSGDSHG